MATCYLSIGTNLGDRKAHIRRVIQEIKNFGEMTACSKPYRTKSYGIKGQPDYINLVVCIKTGLSPEGLITKLMDIEHRMGRLRHQKWESRIIDLDILFYENLVLVTDNLVIPHYDLHNRYFVLRPLADIAADFVHPTLKMTVREMLERVMP